VENQTAKELEGSEKLNVKFLVCAFNQFVHPMVGKLRMRLAKDIEKID